MIECIYGDIMKKKDKKKNNQYQWILTITILAFIISAVFTIISETFISSVNTILGILLVITFVGIGIIFDMIGVAVATSPESPLHSMASKKVKGAKMAIKLKKNADRVSSFCNDVVGDICGIISGSASAVIVVNLVNEYKFNDLFITILVMATIAAFTIGGKATFKGYAMKHSSQILFIFARVLNFFHRIKD